MQNRANSNNVNVALPLTPPSSPSRTAMQSLPMLPPSPIAPPRRVQSPEEWVAANPWDAMPARPGKLVREGQAPAKLGAEYYYTPFLDRPARRVRIVGPGYLQLADTGKIFKADYFGYYWEVLPRGSNTRGGMRRKSRKLRKSRRANRRS